MAYQSCVFDRRHNKNDCDVFYSGRSVCVSVTLWNNTRRPQAQSARWKKRKTSLDLNWKKTPPFQIFTYYTILTADRRRKSIVGLISSDTSNNMCSNLGGQKQFCPTKPCLHMTPIFLIKPTVAKLSLTDITQNYFLRPILILSYTTDLRCSNR